MSTQELACTYACLALHDDGQEITVRTHAPARCPSRSPQALTRFGGSG